MSRVLRIGAVLEVLSQMPSHFSVELMNILV